MQLYINKTRDTKSYNSFAKSRYKKTFFNSIKSLHFLCIDIGFDKVLIDLIGHFYNNMMTLLISKAVNNKKLTRVNSAEEGHVGRGGW